MKSLMMAGLALATVGIMANAYGQEAPKTVPTVGLEVGKTGERLSVGFDGMKQEETRELWNTRAFVGLSTPLFRIERTSWRNEASVGFGLVHQTGHGLLELRDALVMQYELGRGFSIPVGLGLGAILDTERSERSSFQIALPIGLRYKAVELWYRPAVAMPMGAEHSPIFAGYRELSSKPGVQYVDICLRFRMEFLGM
jgi:hypothetical protein